MKPHESALVASVEHCVARYMLIPNDQSVVVAVSGGKDSLALLLALANCGFEVVPAIVDMGYEEGWAKRVASHVDSLGFKPVVIDVRSDGLRTSMSADQQSALTRRISLLETYDFVHSTFATPCTLCYNSKLSVLTAFAKSLDLTTIAFGHHLTDASVSLAKSTLLYIDRWDDGHETFNRHNFSTLVDNVATEVIESDIASTFLLRRTEELVRQQFSGTDEPPKEDITGTNGLYIVRPLFDASEDMVIDFAEERSLVTEGSGCGHGATRDSETPREMVHRRIFRGPTTRTKRDALVQAFSAVIDSTLTPSGEVAARARQLRAKLMGPGYKPAVGNETKM